MWEGGGALIQAWEQDQRVKALKIAIQVSSRPRGMGGGGGGALIHAWEQDQRVKALKIAIQVSSEEEKRGIFDDN